MENEPVQNMLLENCFIANMKMIELFRSTCDQAVFATHWHSIRMACMENVESQEVLFHISRNRSELCLSR